MKFSKVYQFIGVMEICLARGIFMLKIAKNGDSTNLSGYI
jgi:hypothetical protein